MYQAQIQTTDTLMLKQVFVDGPVDSWLTAFVAWAASNTNYRFYTIAERSYINSCSKSLAFSRPMRHPSGPPCGNGSAKFGTIFVLHYAK